MTNTTQTQGTVKKFSLLQAVRELRKPENRVSEEAFCRKHYQIVESLPSDLDEKSAKSISKQLLAEIAHYAVDSQVSKIGYSEQEKKYLHHVVRALRRGRTDVIGVSEQDQIKNKEFMYQIAKRFALQNRDVSGRIIGLAEVIAEDVFKGENVKKREYNKRVFEGNFVRMIGELEYVHFTESARNQVNSLPEINSPIARGAHPLEGYLRLPEIEGNRAKKEKYWNWLRNNLLPYGLLDCGIKDNARFYKEAISEIPGLKDGLRAVEVKHGVNFRLDEVAETGK